MSARRSFKLPDPVDVHRDVVTAFVEQLGHDASKVLRIRLHPRVVEVDLLPPRRDIAKLTVTHQILAPEVGEES